MRAIYPSVTGKLLRISWPFSMDIGMRGCSGGKTRGRAQVHEYRLKSFLGSNIHVSVNDVSLDAWPLIHINAISTGQPHQDAKYCIDNCRAWGTESAVLRVTSSVQSLPSPTDPPKCFWSFPLILLPTHPRLERWQPERVPAVLDPEHAQQERVHPQNDATPDEDSDLLRARVRHTGDLER